MGLGRQLVATAVGMSVRGYRPFASTFAAFFTRAYDFIRMAAVSRASICLCGSHAGVEIGADGPSQMALEDLAMMRAVHGSTVLYPGDATSAAALVEAMADLDGISYMRTTRGAYPVLYEAGESFPVGGSKVLRSAIANATNKDGFSGDVDRLFVSACYANQGPSAKRVRPAPMGRAFRVLKRTAHLTVQVSERPAPEIAIWLTFRLPTALPPAPWPSSRPKVPASVWMSMPATVLLEARSMP